MMETRCGRIRNVLSCKGRSSALVVGWEGSHRIPSFLGLEWIGNGTVLVGRLVALLWLTR